MQRFISEDPIGFCGGDVNLYSYAGNNPVNLTDPLGLEISFDAQGNVIGEEEGLQAPLLSPGDVVGLAGLGLRACGRIALGAGRILGNEIGAIGNIGGRVGARLFPGSVDDVIASAARPSRAGSTTSRAVQGLQKKIDSLTKSTSFRGLRANDATANTIIREVFGVQSPVFQTGTNRAGENVIDIFNPNTGRGIRLLQDSGEFDTFVNLF